MDSQRVNYGFVLGTGRCGSSLIHELLGRHQDVGFLSNIEDRITVPPSMGRWNQALFRHIPSGFTQKGRTRFAPSEGYRALDREVSPVISSPLRDLTAHDVTPWLDKRFRDFFDARAAVQHKAVFLHKFTGWPRAGFIHRVLPDSKFIHIVRDGRAVANSWLQMQWWLGYSGPDAWQWGPLPPQYSAEWDRSDRSFVLLAGLAWKLLLDAFAIARDTVPPEQWLEIRYEDVVADPAGRLREMVDFLGLEWTDQFASAVAGHGLASAPLTRWRDDLGHDAVAVLDKSLADHLRRFDYAIESP